MIQKMWQRYDVQGKGFMDRQEVRHFVEEQMRVEYGIQKVKDDNFDKWFKKLDKDGDGLVEMVEIALKIKYLARMELVSKSETK